MDTMTSTESRSQVLAHLAEWASVGTVARRLHIPRSTVEREVAALRATGKLEARRQTFWRNNRSVVGHEYRVAVIECAPAPVGTTPDERRGEFLAALFECTHGVPMCGACVPNGRRCSHLCVDCTFDGISQEAR